MAIGGLLPVAEALQTVFDGSTLGTSYKVYTYEAGTSTPLATYPTYDDAVAQTNANANPTIADSSGRVAMWGSGTTAYKVVVKTSADVTVKTIDDCYIMPGATTLTSKTPSEYQIAVYENVSGSYKLTNSQTEDGYDFLYTSDGIRLGTNNKLYFRDSDIYIHSSADGFMDLEADGGVRVGTASDTGLYLKEIANASADSSGYGQIWMDTSNRLKCTQDDGEDNIIPFFKGYVTNVSSPPTDAELTSIFGSASSKDYIIGMIDDNGAGTDSYLVWSTGGSGKWFYATGTLAV